MSELEGLGPDRTPADADDNQGDDQGSDVVDGGVRALVESLRAKVEVSRTAAQSDRVMALEDDSRILAMRITSVEREMRVMRDDILSLKAQIVRPAVETAALVPSSSSVVPRSGPGLPLPQMPREYSPSQSAFAPSGDLSIANTPPYVLSPTFPSTPSSVGSGGSRSSGKDTYSKKHQVWAVATLSYIAMVVDMCNRKSISTGAFDVSEALPRMVAVINGTYKCVTGSELPGLAEAQTAYIRGCMSRRTTTEVPTTTAQVWMTLKSNPQGLRAVTVVGNVIRVLRKVRWMIGWPYSSLIPHIGPNLVTVGPAGAEAVPVVSSDFSRYGFGSATSADAFFMSLSMEHLRSFAMRMPLPGFTAYAAIESMGLCPPPGIQPDQ